MPCSQSDVPNFDAIKASKMWNQTLPAWRPMFTPKYVIASLLLLGPVFVALGVHIRETSRSVVEQRLRYDNTASCAEKLQNSPCKLPKAASPDSESYVPQDPLCWRNVSAALYDNECEVPVTVEKDMKGPVYFYYELRNFFQNQRVYVKSQASKQLRGDTFKSEQAYSDYLNSECVESGYDQCESGMVQSSKPGKYFCNPCGLVARSFFTDTFHMEDSTGHNLTGSEWTQETIAWPRDTKEKFRPTPDSNRWNKRTPLENKLVKDPDFAVWMRTAALQDFRKLYRVINRDLHAGEKFKIHIRNNYDVSAFDGEKHFVMSTMSWIGGRNEFLGIIYITVGAACIVLACVFAALECLSEKNRTA